MTKHSSLDLTGPQGSHGLFCSKHPHIPYANKYFKTKRSCHANAPDASAPDQLC